MCEVKGCRKERTITVLGVGLCDKHYLQHCDGEDLDTKHGLLTFRSGSAVLLEPNGGNI